MKSLVEESHEARRARDDEQSAIAERDAARRADRHQKEWHRKVGEAATIATRIFGREQAARIVWDADFSDREPVAVGSHPDLPHLNLTVKPKPGHTYEAWWLSLSFADAPNEPFHTIETLADLSDGLILAGEG